VTQESVYGSSYEDIPRRVPDNSRMREVLGVCAETSLREGLTRTIEWFRNTSLQS
jgi:UDP-glucose 4-epimerase